MPSFIQRYRVPLLLLIVGLPLILAVALLKPQPKPLPLVEAPALPVQAIAIESKPWRLSVTAQGTVEPKRDISLVTEVSGRITQVSPKFVSGGFFTPNERLVKIDDRDYQYAVTRAKAQVANAKQALATEQGRARQAKREWRDLGNSQANDLFLRKPQLASAHANLEAAIADQKNAELNLQRTNITLPYSGRLRKTLVNLGQYVTPGTPIASAYDSSIAEVRLSLTERQSALIDLPLGTHSPSNEQPKVYIHGSVAGQTHQWQGVLTRTDASIDTRSRMYIAIAEVEDPHGLISSKPPLLMGLFVNATIEGKELTDVVRLPKTGLYQNTKVFTVDQNNRIAIQPVTVLSTDDQYAWVSGNLSTGDVVCIEQQHYLKQGMSVSPQLATPGEGQ